MRVKYEIKDLGMRLSGGVILWNDLPYYVQDVTKQSLLLLRLGESDSVTVSIKDEKLQLDIPELGYMNTQGQAHYVMRLPRRQYKQSLTAANCRKHTVGAPKTTSLPANWLGTKAFDSMLRGIYPDVHQAFANLDAGTVRSVAISQEVAISMDNLQIKRIYYKTKPIAYTSPELEGIIKVPAGNYAEIISHYLSDFSWSVE